MRHIIITLFAVLCGVAATAQKPDWAQYNRYSGANDTITTPPVAVFMGNSITDNWLKFRPEFFKDNGFAGRGISGQTTYQMLARFHSDVVALKPKAVAILAGINDIAQNSGPIELENILGNIISMCDIARANGIVPIICSILPCDRFSWRPDLKPAPLVVKLNSMLKEYAESQNIEYTDYHTLMADENGALKDGLSKDRCHPYPEAYKPMEEAILASLNKVLAPVEPEKPYGVELSCSATSVMDNIFARKSVRNYTLNPDNTPKVISKDTLELILKAAMAAPSAMNRQPWEFLVFSNREQMRSLAEMLPYAKMLKNASAAIVVCGNHKESLWRDDCSAAAQNILLATEAMGLGGVWTAVSPSKERVKAVREVLGIPSQMIPLCLIPIGYPSGKDMPKDKWKPEKVHFDEW